MAHASTIKILTWIARLANFPSPPVKVVLAFEVDGASADCDGGQILSESFDSKGGDDS